MKMLPSIHRLAAGRAAALLLGLTLTAALPGAVRAQVPGETDVEEPSLALVTFQIGAVSQVRMIGLPETGEVFVGEEIPTGGDERFLIQPTMPPVQLFARIAPKGTPVPRMIADLDATGLLAGRAVVEAIDVPVQVSPTIFGLRSSLSRIATKVGGGSCQSGNAGKTYFETHHCGAQGGPGYGSSASYCDSDAADWIQRDNGNRRATYSRMASCGTGGNRLRHSYHTTSGWHTQLTVDVASNQVARWWSYKKGVKRDRRTRFDNTNNTGWVRGWSVFWSEVAGGW